MKEITLTRGYVALVDDEDYEELNKFKWYANGKMYAERHRKNENGRDIIVSMHREILKLCRGNKIKDSRRLRLTYKYGKGKWRNDK